MKNRHLIILFLICVLAFILRFYRLSEIPSFHADEADFANNAWSILKTGRDQDGHFLPLGTTSTGDLRPAFYMYLTAGSIALFGYNELATRIPTVIFSILTVILLYYLADELFKNKRIALLACFLLAVSFWDITLSREASEKVVALFLVTAGILALFRYLHRSRPKYAIMAAIAFLISIHTYYSPRLFLLLFLPIAWLLAKKTFPIKKNLAILGIFSAFLTINVYFTFFYTNSRERLNQLSVFKNPKSTAILGELTREEGNTGNPLVTRFFHNKLTVFAFTVAGNYAEYFSPRFLFLDGGQPQRIKIPNIGLMNPIEALFLLLGLFLMISRMVKEKLTDLMILFWWILAAFIPAAFTFDEIPNIYRTCLVIPPLVMVTAYGMISLWAMFNKKRIFQVLILLIGVGYSWFLAYFLHQYFIHYEVHQPWYRNYAQKVLALTLTNRYAKARLIYVPQLYGGVEQMFRFYLKYDPVQFQKDRQTMDMKNQHFLNIIYTPEICSFRDLLKKQQLANHQDIVFVDSPECQRLFWPDDQIEDTIRWKDGLPAYMIIKGKNESIEQVRLKASGSVHEETNQNPK